MQPYDSNQPQWSPSYPSAPQLAAPSNKPAAEVPAASPAPSQEQKTQEARLKVQGLQNTIWLNTLPDILKPLNFSTETAQIKIQDLINFLVLTLIQDLFSHSIKTPENNNYCLGVMAMLQEDPYCSAVLGNITTLFELSDQRKTKVTTSKEAYDNYRRALTFMIKMHGCQGRASQKLDQLLGPEKCKEIFRPIDQDPDSCKKILTVMENLLVLTLSNMYEDLLELREALCSDQKKQSRRDKIKEESFKAEAIFSSFKNHLADAEKFFNLIHRYFSSPARFHSGLMSYSLHSFATLIKQIEIDNERATKFLRELSRANSFQDGVVSKILIERGVPEECVQAVLDAESSEADSLSQATYEHQQLKQHLAKWISWRDTLRQVGAKVQGPRISELQENFLATLNQKVSSKRGVGKKLSRGVEGFVQKMETLLDVAPVIDRLSKSLHAQHSCLRILQPLIAMLETKIASLKVDREAIAQQLTEAFFKEEQPRVRRSKGISKIDEELRIDDQEQEPIQEPNPVSPSSSLSLPIPTPLAPRTRWQQLQADLTSPAAIEKWKTAETSAEMIEEAKLCMRHAAFHVSMLRNQLKLLFRERDSKTARYLPLLSRMLVRSCSLITEQLLTAKLATSDNAAKLSHYHQTLADRQISAKDKDSWTLFQTLEGGAIFHRYPHQFARRCKVQEVPMALQWLLEPRYCSYPQLLQLAENTLIFLGKTLSCPVNDLLEELKQEKSPTPFPNQLKAAWDVISKKFEACNRKVEIIIQKAGQHKAHHWQDVLSHLEGLQMGVNCLIDYPYAETLCSLGDSLLAQAQYLDELIENGRLIQKEGYQLDTHDLQEFRLIRNPPPDKAEQQLVEDLNGDYGTLYPHRYKHNEGRIPKAIKWRFEASRYSVPGTDFDREAQEHENDRQSGFKQKVDRRHPLLDLNEDLIHWIGGIADLSDRRLAELLD
ncbi:MAG: hypothetical protein LLG04_04580 [Parachlamydia sp.]|nr:hypothetical protein [Parachlamydia sp.]